MLFGNNHRNLGVRCAYVGVRASNHVVGYGFDAQWLKPKAGPESMLDSWTPFGGLRSLCCALGKSLAVVCSQDWWMSGIRHRSVQIKALSQAVVVKAEAALTVVILE